MTESHMHFISLVTGQVRQASFGDEPNFYFESLKPGLSSTGGKCLSVGDFEIQVDQHVDGLLFEAYAIAQPLGTSLVAVGAACWRPKNSKVLWTRILRRYASASGCKTDFALEQVPAHPAWMAVGTCPAATFCSTEELALLNHFIMGMFWASQATRRRRKEPPSAGVN